MPHQLTVIEIEIMQVQDKMIWVPMSKINLIPLLSLSKRAFHSLPRSWLLARNRILETLPPLAAYRGRASTAAFPGKTWKRGSYDLYAMRVTEEGYAFWFVLA
jgi:hypothetical protein